MSLPAPPASYKDRVSEAMSQWSRGPQTRQDWDTLARLLGCVHFDRHVLDPEAQRPETEGLRRDAWIELLEVPIFRTSLFPIVDRFILDGLLQNDRWRFLSRSEDGAYQWAVLLATYLESQVPATITEFDAAMNCVVLDNLTSTLSRWLDAPIALDEMNPRWLASNLFGTAWAALMYDSRSADETLTCLIREMRPRFRPGLIAQIEDSPSMSLPLLE